VKQFGALFRQSRGRRASSGPEFASQAGEKAGIVISAQFRLWLQERPHILTEGDSFRFPASIPHRFDNPGAEPTRVYRIVNTQGAQP
jgi:quercetin dioxygenase-like cupin family protein